MQQAHDAIIEKYKTKMSDLEIQLQNAKSSWNMSLKQEVETRGKKITDELLVLEKEAQTVGPRRLLHL